MLKVVTLIYSGGLLMQECDAYAFGVMLYELYSSRPGWAGLSTGDIISAKLRSHASASLQLAPPAPPALQVKQPPPLTPLGGSISVQDCLSMTTCLSITLSFLLNTPPFASSALQVCLSDYSVCLLKACLYVPAPEVVCSSDEPGCLDVHHLLGMLQQNLLCAQDQ